MRIYIEQPAGPDDGSLGRIVNIHDSDDLAAVTFRGNLLRESLPNAAGLPARHVVAWSGTLADELFAPHPMTWMAAGHEQFRARCEELAASLAHAGCTVYFQPNARHVLNDVQSTLTFLNRVKDQPFEIAFDPAGLLESNMLNDVEEHLRRSFELLGPRCAWLVLRDIEFDAAGSETTSRPVGEGVLPWKRLRDLMDAYIDRQTPIVLTEPNIENQLERLEVPAGHSLA